MRASEQSAVAGTVATVRSDLHAGHGGQLVPQLFGDPVEPDPATAADTEQIHHPQPHRNFGGQSLRQADEAGGAVVRIQTVVVDADELTATRHEVFGGITNQTLIARGGHHPQPLSGLEAIPTAACCVHAAAVRECTITRSQLASPAVKASKTLRPSPASSSDGSTSSRWPATVNGR